MPDAVQLLDDENPCGLFYNVALVLTILFLPVLSLLLPILYVREPTKKFPCLFWSGLVPESLCICGVRVSGAQRHRHEVKSPRIHPPGRKS